MHSFPEKGSSQKGFSILVLSSVSRSNLAIPPVMEDKVLSSYLSRNSFPSGKARVLRQSLRA